MMNKKYLMRGMAALALVATVSSCVKDVDGTSAAEEQAKAKENAELQLGLSIPEGQTWETAAQITANVNVNLKSGETYNVAVYSNDPIADGKGIFLTKGTVVNGKTFTAQFTGSKAAKSYIVGVTDKNNFTRYTTGTIENGVLTANFGASEAASRSMRSITVGTDTYSAFNFPTESELAAAFPEAIPAGAEEVEANGSYEYYTSRGGGYNYKITSAGTYTIGGSWQNVTWVVDSSYDYGGYNTVDAYNVYVNVGANQTVTLKRNGNANFNLYILSGKVTLASDFGEMGGVVISVAKGAVLNDARSSIASNYGIKVFNRGTMNATNTEKYDIGNNSTVYNEGVFEAKGPLSYSPGAGNTSYFINMGDGDDDTVDLKAPSMTLNSTCDFYTAGSVEIAGATTVTQAGIVWINNGHYKTGSMKFSAHNGTFYNYCQLIITGECCFTDGAFNMMTDSYAEINYALFNNFHVDMANNSTIYVKSGTVFGRQGAGILQGFYAKDNNTVANVILGGTTKVPTLPGAALHISGAKLNLSYKEMKFYKALYYFDANSYSNTVGNYAEETTKEQLVANKDGDTTWEQHEGATYSQVSDIKFTAPEADECAGTVEENGQTKYEEPVVYTYAFEDQISAGDYDMNDVVLKVTFPVTRNSKNEVTSIDSTKLQVTLVAAGATFNIKAYVGETALFDGQEIHQALGVNSGVMVNTGNGKAQTATPISDTVDIPEDWDGDFSNLDVWIWVNPESNMQSEAKIRFLDEKTVPFAIMVPADWAWPTERTCITEAYPGEETSEGVYDEDTSFTKWASTLERTDAMNSWVNFPRSGKVMTNN